MPSQSINVFLWIFFDRELEAVIAQRNLLTTRCQYHKHFMHVTYGLRNDIQQNYIQDNYRKL